MLFLLRQKSYLFCGIVLLWFLFFTSCVTGNENIYKAYQDFILIKTQKGDTFPSLAEKYLKDPSAGWMIAEFNDLKEITPGLDLIIPFFPFKRGGLSAKGYQTIPVLAYNQFSRTKGEKNSVFEDVFESQMKYLYENGYQVINLDQLLDFLEYKIVLPEKSVAITIDNGWRTSFDIAFPILKKYNFKATFFVFTDSIGSKKTLDWDQLQELSQNGFFIACQTKSNKDLTKPDKEDSFKTYYQTLEKELFYPKQLLQERLKRDCKYLSYPNGSYNNLVIALAQKYGYRGAFTMQRGTNPFFANPFQISRIPINGDEDLAKFKDYLAVFQNRELK